jgi:hypothetical protein
MQGSTRSREADLIQGLMYSAALTAYDIVGQAATVGCGLNSPIGLIIKCSLAATGVYLAVLHCALSKNRQDISHIY